jgi:hypothetical protein
MEHPRATSWRLLFRLFGLALTRASAARKNEAGSPASEAAPEVQVAQEDLPVYTEWIGTTNGFVNATIKRESPAISLSAPSAKVPSSEKAIYYSNSIPVRFKRQHRTGGAHAVA